MNKPRVSVVMSVYNEPLDLLCQSVESILLQTYYNFEFIIIYDNPDYNEGYEYLVKYAQKDGRIILIFNSENLGLTKSLNIGLQHAIGDYIVRMDADDYSYPTRIEKQVCFMDSHKELVASGCYAKLIDDNGNDVGEMHTSADIKYLRALLPFRTPIYHPSAIIRRIINGKPFRYNESYFYSQDYALWFNIIENGISNLPEYLIKYRLSGNQISNKYKEKIRDLDIEIRKGALRRYYLGLSDNDINFLIFFYYDMLDIQDNQTILIVLKKLRTYNLTNKKIEINSSILFLYFLYCRYLSKHYSLLKSIIHALRAKHMLKISTYKGLVSILMEKLI